MLAIGFLARSVSWQPKIMGPPPVHVLLSKMVREQKSLVGINIFCNTLLDPLKKSLAALSVGFFTGVYEGDSHPQRWDSGRDESSDRLPRILLSRFLSR